MFTSSTRSARDSAVSFSSTAILHCATTGPWSNSRPRGAHRHAAGLRAGCDHGFVRGSRTFLTAELGKRSGARSRFVRDTATTRGGMRFMYPASTSRSMPCSLSREISSSPSSLERSRGNRCSAARSSACAFWRLDATGGSRLKCEASPRNNRSMLKIAAPPGASTPTATRSCAILATHEVGSKT